MTRMKKMSLRTYEPEPEEIGREGRGGSVEELEVHPRRIGIDGDRGWTRSGGDGSR